MECDWNLPDYCFTEQGTGQRKVSIGNVEWALGFRNGIDAHEKYRKTPMHELHERILMLDELFNSMTAGELRISAAVNDETDQIFHEMGPHLWPESKKRFVWLISASEESRVEYPQDL